MSRWRNRKCEQWRVPVRLANYSCARLRQTYTWPSSSRAMSHRTPPPVHSFLFEGMQCSHNSTYSRAGRSCMACGSTEVHFAPAALSMSRSSPDLYISIVVSQPPMNSPWTYTCQLTCEEQVTATSRSTYRRCTRKLHAHLWNGGPIGE